MGFSRDQALRRKLAEQAVRPLDFVVLAVVLDGNAGLDGGGQSWSSLAINSVPLSTRPPLSGSTDINEIRYGIPIYPQP